MRMETELEKKNRQKICSEKMEGEGRAVRRKLDRYTPMDGCRKRDPGDSRVKIALLFLLLYIYVNNSHLTEFCRCRFQKA